MRTFRAFTLFEVMIAFTLFLVASSIFGVRIYRSIEKKKFHSQLICLKDQFRIAQRLAVAMQADWQGVLKRGENGFLFEAKCVEVPEKKLKGILLGEMAIRLNGKKIEEFEIDFFSTGVVVPKGSLSFSKNSEFEHFEIEDFEGVSLR